MANKVKMTKREVCELVSAVTILIHNRALDEVMSNEEIDKMMTKFMEIFGSDEEKALKHYKDRVLNLKEKLFN